jgi:hypothetical protein
LRKAVDAHRSAATGKADQLNELASRIRRDERLATYDVADLDHEALVAEHRANAVAGSAPSLRQLAKRVADRLLGADVRPAALADAADVVRYREEPISAFTFAKGDARKRRTFARLFCADLTDRALLDEMGPEPSAEKLLDAAKKQSAEFPEFPDLKTAWSARAFTRQIELAKFADEFGGPLNEPATGDKLRLKWIAEQERKIVEAERAAKVKSIESGASPPARDAQSRFDLATTALEWFPDQAEVKETARKLMNESLRIDPGYTDAEVKLRAMGYLPNRRGEYVDPKAPPAKSPDGTVAVNDPNNDDQAPLPPGFDPNRAIKKGDPADQVRRLLGKPNSVTRVVGRNWAKRYWRYDQLTYVMTETPSDGAAYVSDVVPTK